MRLLFSAGPTLLAGLVLLGWGIHDNGLTSSFIRHGGAMDPSTALGFVLLGVPILLIQFAPNSQTVTRLCRMMLLIVVAGASIKLWNLLTNASYGTDSWMFTSELEAQPGAQIRPAPNTALGILLLGFPLLLVLRPRQVAGSGFGPSPRAIALMQLMATLPILIALFVLTGYLYHSISLTGIAVFAPVPMNTALTLMSLSIAVLSLFPQRGIVRYVSNNGPAGEMARFLLPMAVLVPIGLGWLRIVGMHARLFDAEFGLALSTLLNIVMLSGLTLVAARKLFHSDQKAKAVEQELLYRATHDSLTGLVNRPVFREQLMRRLKIAARRKGASFAVFYLDLDGFKQVNDLLGHDAGDKLLVQVADLLRACTRGGDTVARFGGDEFVILFEEIDAPLDAETMAQRILSAMPRSFGTGKVTVPIGISIGIATSATQLTSPDEFLREADMALYRAKTRGKCRYEVAGAA